MKVLLQFLNEFILFIGLLVLGIFLFIALQIAIDINNPCSNFSDVQDQCEQR